MRLARGALRPQIHHQRTQLLTVAVLEHEIDTRYHEAWRQIGAPVREIHFVLGQRAREAVDGDAMHERHHARHLAAEGSGVHNQSTTNRAWDTLAKFESGESAIDNSLDHRAELHRGTGSNVTAIDYDTPEARSQLDDQAAHASIADQQISSGAETHRWNFVP